MSLKFVRKLNQVAIVLFGLGSLFSSVAFAQSVFVIVEMRCSEDGKGSSSYQAKLYGAVDKQSLALARSWNEGNGVTGVSPLTGMIKGNQLVIQGDATKNTKKKMSWPFYFSVTTSNNIIKDLEAGLEGFEGSGKGKRSCNIKLESQFPQTSVVVSERRKNEILDLKAKLQIAENGPSGSEVTALNEEITSLKKQLEDATQKSKSAPPSDNLIQMATAIASLKGELNDRENLVTELNQQIISLRGEVDKANTLNSDQLSRLEQTIVQKDADLNSLKIALKTLQDMQQQQACPEPTDNKDVSSNNPVIQYLEQKNADLTKRLEGCGTNIGSASQGSAKDSQENNVEVDSSAQETGKEDSAEEESEVATKTAYEDGERACLANEYDFLEKIHNFAGFRLSFEKGNCIHKGGFNEIFYGIGERLSGWNSVYYTNPARLQIRVGFIPKSCVLIRGGMFEIHHKADCMFM